MNQRIYTFAMIALLGFGCGPPPPATPRGGEATIEDLALVEVGEIYRVHSVEQGRPPKALQDVAPLETGFSLGYQALANGDVVLPTWGVPLPDLSEQSGVVESDEVLAYQKPVPDEGGLVLLLDRRIVEMTPEEFQAAPKVGGAATTATDG